jgi:ElaB/YqjD/DUF883 family membrane-anchored ribosome-binding protein
MPGDGISHEAYPHDRGEQGFTAQKQSAFPALAVLKSLVHEELGRKEKKDQVIAYVQENPGKSVLIALCVGFLVGFITRPRD